MLASSPVRSLALSPPRFLASFSFLSRSLRQAEFEIMPREGYRDSRVKIDERTWAGGKERPGDGLIYLLALKTGSSWIQRRAAALRGWYREDMISRKGKWDLERQRARAATFKLQSDSLPVCFSSLSLPFSAIFPHPPSYSLFALCLIASVVLAPVWCKSEDGA